MTECGGCGGLGAHAKTCAVTRGRYAAVLYEGARYTKSLGDTVGPNNMALSSLLWRTSAELTAEAARNDKSLTDKTEVTS